MSTIQFSKSNMYTINAPSIENSKYLRQLYIITAIALLEIVCTLPFGLLALFKSEYALSSILLSLAVLSILNYIFIIKKKISYRLSSEIIVYPLLILMIYLVSTGGINNTGSLWIYSQPAMVLFLYGLRKGMIVLSLFTLILAAILFIPENIFLSTVYTFAYKIRLLLVFILNIALTAAYEYSTVNLMGKMKLLTEELTSIAEEDQLTQIRNRRGVHHQMERIFEQAKRDKNMMSLIMCDIDYFKKVNDQYGHEAGDEVLIAVANIIKNTIRKTDIPSRWGGEEFLIVLPKTSAKEAYLVAEKIRKNVQNLLIVHETSPIKVSLSAGVANSSQCSTIEKLIKLADSYMYEAKTKGRNNTCAINF